MRMRWGFGIGLGLSMALGCGNGGVAGVDDLPRGLARGAAPQAGFERGANGWTARLEPGAASGLDVLFPEAAGGRVKLEDTASGVGIGVRMARGEAVPGRVAGGFLVYPGAAGPGATLLYRAAPTGMEDYVALDERPLHPEVLYRVTLSEGVAGLRLVSRTLEFVDDEGIPRLRIAPPYVLGADGARVEAELDVQGCAVDTDPTPPFQRRPVPAGDTECGVRVSWDDAKVSYPALVDPAWTTTTSMSTAREHFAAALLDDARVLVAGGISGDASPPLASSEVYDPESRSWAATGALATGRHSHTLTLLEDGQVLAGGGEAGEGTLASTELYDALTGTWSPGPEMTAPHSGHGAVRLPNGNLLVAGGNSSAPTLFDAASSRWTPTGPLLAEEPGSTLTGLSDGDALLVGPNAPLAQVYRSQSNDWAEVASPSLSRSQHTATRLANGDVLVVGGDGQRSAELYAAATRTWARVGATNDVHSGHTATPLPDGRIAIVGGGPRSEEGAAPLAARSTELYNPRWGTWTPGPLMAAERTGQIAVALKNGRVLVAGGQGRDGAPLADAEELDAALLPVTIGEYKLPASRDTSVSSVITELWAAVARPSVLKDGRRYPLILFLHGNHATCGTGENPRQDSDCTYTDRGVCPDGFVVAPSHRGYDYMAEELAARGYIVVSVNANRGINCGGDDPEDSSMNIPRGRLLLKHLQRLSEWDRGAAETPDSLGTSLFGKLDFNQVGIMGHSRGGEGARAAYQQFRDPGSPWPQRIGEPLVFRGIFEIGPVDGQSPRTFDADGTAWNVLLPLCDGDVSDLEGVRPFDRMLKRTSESLDTSKSTYTAWGTNHNYYNTEWQESDSQGCQDHRALFETGPGITGSAEQRQIGLRSLLTFFLANVGTGANPAQNQLFDPAAPVEFETRIDRGYTQGLRFTRGFTLADFTGTPGGNGSAAASVSSDVSVTYGPIPEHDASLRGASVRWDRPSSNRFFELRFSAAALGLDLGRYTHLEFRVERADDPENPVTPTALNVQLVNPDETLSEPVDVAGYGVVLDGPGGGPFSRHSMLQTARIPLADFTGASPSAVLGVRFSFPASEHGSVYLASVRVGLGSALFGRPSRNPSGAFGVATRPPTARPPSAPIGLRAPVQKRVLAQGNQVAALRRVERGQVEVELITADAFKARDDQLLLSIGSLSTTRSSHPGGDLRRVVFTLDGAAFAAVPDRAPLGVRYGSNDAVSWDFGPLDKTRLAP